MSSNLLPAYLVLQDGTIFKGNAIGKIGTTTGEIAFNTGMTGYQEVFTDPSYFGQILIMTNDHIGNYGANAAEVESDSIKISGLVVKKFSPNFSRKQNSFSLDEYLTQNGLTGISDIDTRRLVLSRSLDMRYVGQEHAVTVEIPLAVFTRQGKAGIKKHFDELHKERYGRGSPEEPAEIVSIRSTVTGVMAKPRLAKIDRGSARPVVAASSGTRRVFFPGHGWLKCATWKREALKAGNRIQGPALIEEHASTTVVQPGDALKVDAFGNLIISIGLASA